MQERDRAFATVPFTGHGNGMGTTMADYVRIRSRCS